MRIIYSSQGEERVLEAAETPVIIGRPIEGATVSLDLTPDLMVSRLHARLWEKDGEYWVVDLSSTSGTQLNGLEIRNKGPHRLRSGDKLKLGDTLLTIFLPSELLKAAPPPARSVA